MRGITIRIACHSHSAGRPTHFISLYLGLHADLRDRVDALLSSFFHLDPPLQVDKRYIEPAIRLHVTCGVMRLPDKSAVAGALELLRDCRPSLLDLLGSRSLRVQLKGLGGFPPDSVHKTRVVYLKPCSADGSLESVAELLHARFKEQGYVTDSRDLTLHATLIKLPPYPRKMRLDILENGLLSLPADMGEFEVPEVLLCRMGQYEASGQHKSEGRISLSLDADDSE